MFKNGKSFFINTEQVLDLGLLSIHINEQIQKHFQKQVCPFQIAKKPLDLLISKQKLQDSQSVFKNKNYDLINFCDKALHLLEPPIQDFIFTLFSLIILFREVSQFMSQDQISIQNLVHFSLKINKGIDGFEFETKKLIHHPIDLSLLKQKSLSLTKKDYQFPKLNKESISRYISVDLQSLQSNKKAFDGHISCFKQIDQYFLLSIEGQMSLFLVDFSLNVLKQSNIKNLPKMHTIQILQIEYIKHIRRVFLLLSNNTLVAWDLPQMSFQLTIKLECQENFKGFFYSQFTQQFILWTQSFLVYKWNQDQEKETNQFQVKIQSEEKLILYQEIFELWLFLGVTNTQRIFVLDPETNDILLSKQLQIKTISKINYIIEYNLLVFFANEYNVLLFQLEKEKFGMELNFMGWLLGHQALLVSGVYSKILDCLITIDESSCIKFWDLVKKQCYSTEVFKASHKIKEISLVDQDTKLVLISKKLNKISLIIESKEQEQSFQMKNILNVSLNSEYNQVMIFHQDDIYLLDHKTGRRKAIRFYWQDQEFKVQQILLLENGRKFIALLNDGNLEIYDYLLNRVGFLQKHQHIVQQVIPLLSKKIFITKTKYEIFIQKVSSLVNPEVTVFKKINELNVLGNFFISSISIHMDLMILCNNTTQINFISLEQFKYKETLEFSQNVIDCFTVENKWVLIVILQDSTIVALQQKNFVDDNRLVDFAWQQIFIFQTGKNLLVTSIGKPSELNQAKFSLGYEDGSISILDLSQQLAKINNDNQYGAQQKNFFKNIQTNFKVDYRGSFNLIKIEMDQNLYLKLENFKREKIFQNKISSIQKSLDYPELWTVYPEGKQNQFKTIDSDYKMIINYVEQLGYPYQWQLKFNHDKEIQEIVQICKNSYKKFFDLNFRQTSFFKLQQVLQNLQKASIKSEFQEEFFLAKAQTSPKNKILATDIDKVNYIKNKYQDLFDTRVKYKLEKLSNQNKIAQQNEQSQEIVEQKGNAKSIDPSKMMQNLKKNIEMKFQRSKLKDRRAKAKENNINPLFQKETYSKSVKQLQKINLYQKKNIFTRGKRESFKSLGQVAIARNTLKNVMTEKNESIFVPQGKSNLQQFLKRLNIERNQAKSKVE